MERTRNWRWMVLFANVSILLFAALPLLAQTANTGAVAGTVTDPTGAVIPGVTVIARIDRHPEHEL